MSKFVGFIIGAIEIGVGIYTGNPALIASGTGMIITQAVVDLTAPKQPSRTASEMSIALGEQPRVILFGETFTPGSLVDGFDYGGKYGTDWEVLIIRLADHKCHSLTGFFVNDDWNPYVSDGLVPRYDDQLKIYFRADTNSIGLPSIVTDNGPGWTSADIGQSGCDVIVAYKADKEQDKHPGWPGGRPRFGFVVKGKECYDPRFDSTVTGGSGPHRWDDPDTWEWSENPVVCWYNYERGIFSDDDTSDPTKLLVGRGLSAQESPPEYTFAAANLCDDKLGTIYPSPTAQTSIAFNPAMFSPDGMILYTVNASGFASVNLATRSQVMFVTLTAGPGGGFFAAVPGGVYFLDSSSNLFFGRSTGTVTQVFSQAEMGLFGAGVGCAGGDVWIYPHSFDPLKIGQLTGDTFNLTSVNFNATQVFTTVGGDAMAVGTTSGHVLAIGPAGSSGTLIDTTAYGTSGDVFGFDAGTHYIAEQGDHLFIINNTGTPAIVSAVTIGSVLRPYESFAATAPGAGSFWLDGSEYDSSDLSLIRTPDLTLFLASVGGTPSGGVLYDSINHALVISVSGVGLAFYMLDRDGSYRVAGPIYSTQAFIDVEQMFASATAGAIVTRDGAVELEPGAAKSVVATFTDADLVVGSKVSWNQGFLSESSDDWVNTVVGQYVEPDQNWNSHASPALRDTDDIIADGKPREQQVTLRLVRYLAQALRICEIGRRLGRLWGRATVTLPPRFCEIEDNDWVQWQSDRYFAGGTKTFRVDAYSIDEKWQNTLNLREINGAAFAADGVYPIDYSRPTTTAFPPDSGSPDAGNWTLVAVTLDSTGVSVPALEISGSASDDIYAQSIIFEYWPDDGVTDPTLNPESISWLMAGTYSAATTKTDITSVIGGATYYAAVSYVVDGVPGDRLVLGPVTLSDFVASGGGGGTTTATSVFSMTPNDQEGGWNGFTLRQALPASLLADAVGTKIRFTVGVPDFGNELKVSEAYIQTRGSGTYDYSAAPVQFSFGGNSGFDFVNNGSGGHNITSDWVDFSYDGTHDLIICMVMGTGAVSNRFYANNSISGPTIGYKSGSDGGSVTVSGYSVDGEHCVILSVEIA